MKSFILLAIVSLSAAGCNPTDSKDIQRDATKLAESSTRSLINASLAAKVNTALALRKGVDMTKFSVKSEAGVVTLTGTISSRKEKLLILEMTKETRGVEKVVDKLAVKPE
jgi:osmotically-inducible protein OsmY